MIVHYIWLAPPGLGVKQDIFVSIQHFIWTKQVTISTTITSKLISNQHYFTFLQFLQSIAYMYLARNPYPYSYTVHEHCSVCKFG